MTPGTIKRTREALGLTQAEAAELIFADRVTWARYESKGADARAMSPVVWQYFQHVAGLRAIPFRPFRASKRGR